MLEELRTNEEQTIRPIALSVTDKTGLLVRHNERVTEGSGKVLRMLVRAGIVTRQASDVAVV